MLLTSGEAKLLMVLLLLSTQAVKKYCFLPNNTAQAVVIPHPQTTSTVYFISRALSPGNSFKYCPSLVKLKTNKKQGKGKAEKLGDN